MKKLIVKTFIIFKKDIFYHQLICKSQILISFVQTNILELKKKHLK